jgi:hypothetical protein
MKLLRIVLGVGLCLLLVCVGCFLLSSTVKADSRYINYDASTGMVMFANWSKAHELGAFDALIENDTSHGWGLFLYANKTNKIMVFNTTIFYGFQIGNASYDFMSPYEGDETWIAFENDTFILSDTESSVSQLFYVVNHGHLRMGKLINETRKETDNGCRIVMYTTYQTGFINAGVGGIETTRSQSIFVYSTYYYASYSSGVGLIDILYSNNSFYNDVFRATIFSSNGQFNIYNCQWEMTPTVFSTCAGQMVSLTARSSGPHGLNSVFFPIPGLLMMGAPSRFSVSNTYIVNYTYLASSAWGRTAANFWLDLIDCQTNGSWNMYYKATSGSNYCHSSISRNYTISGKIKWDTTLLNATSIGVKVLNCTNKVRFTTTTNSNGVFSPNNIVYQTWVPKTSASPWYTLTNHYPFRLVFYNTSTGYEYANFSIDINKQYNATWYIKNCGVTTYNNSVNCSLVHQKSYTVYTGWKDWANATGPQLLLRKNIVNATVTTQGRYNSTTNKMMSWSNGSGVTTPIHTLDVMRRCIGSLAYILNSTGYWVTSNHLGNQSGIVLNDMSSGVTGSLTSWWSNLTGINGEYFINDTHTGISGGGSTPFLMTSPNPANNSLLPGGLMNNNIVPQSSGLNTSVDISFKNFTTPSEKVGNESIPSYVLYTGSVQNGSFFSGYDYVNKWNSNDATTNESGDSIWIGHVNYSWGATLWRGIFSFNTTMFSGQNIISGKLRLYCGQIVKGASRDFSVVIQNGQPLYPHLPFIKSDFNKVHYTGNGGQLNSTSMVIYMFKNITLNPTGLSWINHSGITKFCLRLDREIAGNLPKDTYEYFQTENRFVGIDDYRPLLIIEYRTDWSHVVNLSWYSNSSGTWTLYGSSFAVSNGTQPMFNPNFTNASTQYWYRVVASCNGTILDNQTYTFTTGTNGELIAIPLPHHTRNDLVLGLSGGTLMSFSIGVVIISRLRKKKEEGDDDELV